MCCETVMEGANHAREILQLEPDVCPTCGQNTSRRESETQPNSQNSLPDLVRDIVPRVSNSQPRNPVLDSAIDSVVNSLSNPNTSRTCLSAGSRLTCDFCQSPNKILMDSQSLPREECTERVAESHKRSLLSLSNQIVVKPPSNLGVLENRILHDRSNLEQIFQEVSGESVSISDKVEYTQIKDTKAILERSLKLVRTCGFYHGSLSMDNARRKLKGAPIGSFLLRDSSDKRFILSLSIKTQRGTTSIRISFQHGRFRLDCEESAHKKMPSFPCLISLVEYYVESGKSDAANNCVFLESTGRKDTPVLLTKPFLSEPMSLKHMARLQLNQMQSEDQRKRFLLFMPPSIENYLQEYPYKV